MDYNINFKYKSGGGTASSGMGAIGGMRSKAIQASTKQGATGTLRPDDSAKKLIDTNIKLSTNILKLNQSVTMLTATIKNRGMGSGGGSGGSGGGGSSDSSGHSIGMIGAGIGMGVGVAAGITGFAVQKINQIGNAYIEKVSQQKGSVGVGGFRYGQGMYNATEMGEGMKAFGMASGEFADETYTYRDKKNKQQTAFTIRPDESAIQMGNIYGLSAAETLGQAGTFQRAGADYSQAVNRGAGAGLESELPAFAATLASTLEDAIKSGLDTSDMRKDLSGTLLNLVKNAPGMSVEGAMTVARSGAGTKKSGAAGQVVDVKGLLGWKVGQRKALEDINTSAGLQSILDEGIIDKGQAENLNKIKQNRKITEADLYKEGVNASFLTQRSIEKMQDTDYATEVYKQGREEFKGLKTGEMSQIMQYTGSENAMLYKSITNPVKDMSATEKKGKELNRKKSAKVTKGIAGQGVSLERSRENLLLNEGQPFAEKTMELNKIFTTMATKAAPGVVAGMNKVFDAAERAALGLSAFAEKVEKFSNTKTGKYTKALLTPGQSMTNEVTKDLYDYITK